MIERCPGCSRDVEESATECPYCGRKFAAGPPKPALRPSRPPEPPQRRAIRPDPPKPKRPFGEDEEPAERRSLKSAFFLFLGASALFGGYLGRKYLPHPAPIALPEQPAAAKPGFREPLLESETRPGYPQGQLPQGQLPQQVVPGQYPAGQAPNGAGPQFEYQPGPSPYEVEQRQKKTGPKKPDLPPPVKAVSVPCAKRGPVRGMGRNEWCLAGQVFDLRSLAPAKGARLVFRDTAGRGLYAETDGKGRYGVALPANMEGFTLAIEHPDFGTRYIEDWVPSVRTFKADKRAETAEDLVQTPHEPETVFGNAGQRFFKDYALVKESASAATSSETSSSPSSP